MKGKDSAPRAHKPSTQTTKLPLPTSPISKKKIDNNSPSAIMKREKNKRMKKNLEDLRNHAIKQATGRGPSMPALGGVLQPSLPDCFEEVHRELNLLPEDGSLNNFNFPLIDLFIGL